MSATERPLLAIDTSTHSAGIALYGADGPLAELTWPAGRSQTTRLLSEIDRLCDLCGLLPGDLGALAIATGPGSFNGLRVGMSTAKGLAFALNLPLLGIPTLDGVAYPHSDRGRPVRATVAAGRARFVSAIYRWQEKSFRRASDYENTTLEGLAGLIVAPTLVCGEVTSEQLSALAPLAEFAPPVLNLRRATYLAEIAWSRLARNERDDPATLEPIYVHGSRPDPASTPEPEEASALPRQASPVTPAPRR